MLLIATPITDDQSDTASATNVYRCRSADQLNVETIGFDPLPVISIDDRIAGNNPTSRDHSARFLGVVAEQFGDLALLLHPKTYVRKIETVGILIFWILVLGTPLRHLTETLLPGLLAPFWEDFLLVSVSVVLISYVLLPWSCKMLTRLKTLTDKTRVR